MCCRFLITPCTRARFHIIRLGLQRSAGVKALDTQVATYVLVFEEEEACQRVKEEFRQRALQLIEEGAEVIIPTGSPQSPFGQLP